MRVAVLGASGPVGAATVRALLDHSTVPAVVAITRHPPAADAAVNVAIPATATAATAAAANDSATAPWPMDHPRLSVVAGSVADAAGLRDVLAAPNRVDALFVVPPPSPLIDGWVADVAAAATAAGVARLAVLSVLRRVGSDAPYGEWFRAMEGRLAAQGDGGGGGGGGGGGTPACVLRAAMFYENLLALRGQLQSTGVLVGVAPPDAVTPSVAVADLGAAAAAVLTAPPVEGGGWPHAGATYDLISDAPTNDATAAALSFVMPRAAADGPSVRYKQVDAAEAVASAVAAGVPEVTAAALVELAATTAAGTVKMRTASEDLRAVLGGTRGGMDVATWARSTADAWAAS